MDKQQKLSQYWIWVQVQGGAEFQPAGILVYVEELKLSPNAEIGPIDSIEIASK
jgi:hypothetical protein